MPAAPRQPTSQVIAYMGRNLRFNDFGLEVGQSLMALPPGGAILRATCQTLVAWTGSASGALRLGWTPTGAEIGQTTAFLNVGQTAIQLQAAQIGPLAVPREIYCSVVATGGGAFVSGLTRIIAEFVPHAVQDGSPPLPPGA